VLSRGGPVVLRCAVSAVALRGAVLAAAAGAVAGCASGPAGSAAEPAAPPVLSATPGAAPPTAPPATPAVRSPDASPEARQLMMIHDITAVFENGRVVPQYAFISDQHDGCGFTAGWIGFCTKYGDLLDVVKVYNAAVPGNVLAKHTRALQRLATARTDGTTGLGRAFAADWKRAARDPVFRRVQLGVGHAAYLTPARKVARREGITTPLGLENLFDTALMMGPGTAACDGLLKIAAETHRVMRGGPATGVPEAAWLRRFNEIRIRRLRHPCAPGRQADWPRAVGRPQALQELADQGNWQLTPPVRIGGTYDLIITTPAD
jgi:chitosanase